MLEKLVTTIPALLQDSRWQRYVSGVIAAFVLVTAIFQPVAWPFAVLVVIVQSIGISEVHNLFRTRGIEPVAPLSYIFGLSFTAAAFFEGYAMYTGLVLLTFFGSFAWRIFAKGSMPHLMAQSSATLTSVVYMGMIPSFLLLIRTYQGTSVLGSLLLIWMFGVVTIGDTGAYIFGKRFGKTKLAPTISPNKTWEGLLGGVFMSVLTGVIIGRAAFPVWPISHMIAVTLVIQLFAHTGDLIESIMKRSCGVKDSGAFLPGHGGVLDRADGIVMGGVVMYLYVHHFSIWAL